MNTRHSMLPGMADALRLVRSGHLRQALAAIQQGLHGRAAPPSETPASPASVPSGGERFESHSYANHAGTREYKLYVPATYQGQALPLVVMLHGCTQSPDDFAVGTRMNELAARHGFLVAYPAQTRQANPNKCWNWFNRSEQQRGEGEPSLIAGIVQAIRANHDVDAARIYVAGLSSGGAMAATLAATYPELFAAVGVHSGLAHGAAHDLPSGLAAMRSGGTGVAVAGVPAIVFHGDRDPLVHPRNGEELVSQRLSGNPEIVRREDSGGDANGRAYTRHSVHSASGRPLVEHWVIHGAGHAWSGGNPRGTHTDPGGPDASSEMLRFFLACTPS